MKTTRKRYSADFKAKVALEAIRGDLTLAELAAKHGVHHTMIASWKRQAIEGMAGTFSGAGDVAKAVSESEVEKTLSKLAQTPTQGGLFVLEYGGTERVLLMMISRDTLADLRGMQEDMAAHFVDENFPISGETYWTCVECLATAKLAELRGELSELNTSMQNY